MLRRRYTPQLSELLATVQAWKITTYYESCLGLELTSDIQADTSDYTSRGIAFQAELRRLRRIIASRLFTAKRTLFSEGLGDTFDEVTKKLHIEHIWSDAREANVYGHRTLKKQLAMCQPRNPEEGRQDKLTSLNEWLLETFMAIPWHQELYVSLCTSSLLPSVSSHLGYTHKSANGDMTYQYGFTFNSAMYTSLHILNIKSDDSLLRQCIKFWFLDAASMLQEAVAPSTIATSDSDATFRPTGGEAIPTSIELVSEHSKIYTAIHLENPKCSLLNLEDFRITGWKDEDVELPPNNVSQEDLARAATTLKEYQGFQSSPLMGDGRSEFL
ncbi:MAG: hypothetical protein Q9202_006893 [Teloschistes flavicans]